MTALPQAYSQWLERAAPFIALLLLVFLKHHILGKHLIPLHSLNDVCKLLYTHSLVKCGALCWSGKLQSIGQAQALTWELCRALQA